MCSQPSRKNRDTLVCLRRTIQETYRIFQNDWSTKTCRQWRSRFGVRLARQSVSSYLLDDMSVGLLVIHAKHSRIVCPHAPTVPLDKGTQKRLLAGWGPISIGRQTAVVLASLPAWHAVFRSPAQRRSYGFFGSKVISPHLQGKGATFLLDGQRGSKMSREAIS